MGKDTHNIKHSLAHGLLVCVKLKNILLFLYYNKIHVTHGYRVRIFVFENDTTIVRDIQSLKSLLSTH